MTVENLINVSAIRDAALHGGIQPRIIAIDGAGGTGKSTLAEQLAAVLANTQIIHTDDFATWGNPLNWWPRMIEQVLEPLSRNEPGHYQRYDWDSKERAEWHEVPVAHFILLEGVSASREAFRHFLAYTIWVETPRAERLRRGLHRDGEAARDQWEVWMSREDEYIARELPAEHADAIIDGARPVVIV